MEAYISHCDVDNKGLNKQLTSHAGKLSIHLGTEDFPPHRTSPAPVIPSLLKTKPNQTGGRTWIVANVNAAQMTKIMTHISFNFFISRASQPWRHKEHCLKTYTRYCCRDHHMTSHNLRYGVWRLNHQARQILLTESEEVGPRPPKQNLIRDESPGPLFGTLWKTHSRSLWFFLPLISHLNWYAVTALASGGSKQNGIVALWELVLWNRPVQDSDAGLYACVWLLVWSWKNALQDSGLKIKYLAIISSLWAS